MMSARAPANRRRRGLSFAFGVAFTCSMIVGLSSGCRQEGGGYNQADARADHEPRLPKLTGRVVDNGGILSDVEEAMLTSKLATLEAASGHQMVIVSVTDLRGEDIAILARDLGNHWGIGREDEDDGILILVAPKERRVRLAVGLGLEDVLTEQVCVRIIEQSMMPAFAKRDYASGLSAAIDALSTEVQSTKSSSPKV